MATRALLLRLFTDFPRRLVLEAEQVVEAIRILVRRVPQPGQLPIRDIRVLREVMRMVLTYVFDRMNGLILAEVVKNRVVRHHLAVAGRVL